MMIAMVVGDRKGENLQGELLARRVLSMFCEGQVDSMRNSGLCFVNGRKDNNDFTYVSSKGCSVVDYCLVLTGDYNYIDEFSVTAMSKCEATLHADEEGLRIPDHSVPTWKVLAVECIDRFVYAFMTQCCERPQSLSM